MLFDIFFSIYIILLFPFLYECEKLKSQGLKYLLIGVVFTPIAGYLALILHRRKQIARKNPISKAV